MGRVGEGHLLTCLPSFFKCDTCLSFSWRKKSRLDDSCSGESEIGPWAKERPDCAMRLEVQGDWRHDNDDPGHLQRPLSPYSSNADQCREYTPIVPVRSGTRRHPRVDGERLRSLGGLRTAGNDDSCSRSSH